MKQLRYPLFILCLTVLGSCSKKEDLVTIHTDFGDIQLILFDQTPLHKKNFLELVNRGFYDSLTFHRIIDGFMIQGGDPNSKDNDPFNDGLGGPGYTIPAEFRPSLTHVPGAVAAARQPDNVNPEKASSGSQFYIVENEQGTHQLDGSYTVFGQVIHGMDVVRKIAVQPKDSRNRPLKNIRMTMDVVKMAQSKITENYGYRFKE